VTPELKMGLGWIDYQTWIKSARKMPNRVRQDLMKFQIITKGYFDMGDKIPSSLGNEIPLIGITVPQNNVHRMSVLRHSKGGLCDAPAQSEGGLQ